MKILPVLISGAVAAAIGAVSALLIDRLVRKSSVDSHIENSDDHHKSDEGVLAALEKVKKALKVKRKPHRIILIRHGESLGNTDKTIYARYLTIADGILTGVSMPDSQIPLTDKGRAQATEAGRRLREVIGEESVEFYVSPFLRSRQTFEQLAVHFEPEKFSVREDPRLREQEWGNLQPVNEQADVAQIRRHVGRFYYRFPTGESGADVYDRASAFLDSLNRRFAHDDRPRNIVIVSHGLFVRLFLMRYFHWSVERFERIDNFNNCEYVIMALDQATGKFELDPSTPLRLYETKSKSLQTRFAPLEKPFCEREKCSGCDSEGKKQKKPADAPVGPAVRADSVPNLPRFE